MIWLGIVSESGGGKSPVIDAGMKFAKSINSDMVRESNNAKATWWTFNKGLKQADREPPPPWQQLVIHDATVEAMVDVLKDNPSGVILCSDELTRWIGQMDYYSGKGGGDRDRAYWLEAYDGREISMNRKSNGNVFVENWSASVIGGIQPGKLAEAYAKSSGGGSDGLYQRFNLYCMQPSKDMSLYAVHNAKAENFLQVVAKRIQKWSKSGLIANDKPRLNEEAVQFFQDYGNNMRTVQKTTGNPRLSEHIGKFVGFLGRLSLVLHVIECAEANSWTHVVGIETVRRADKILACLFRHSEASYQLMEEKFSGSTLMQDIANTILAKGYKQFTCGDLMRNCGGWRKVEPFLQQSALTKLEEMGWILDITEGLGGGRGRPTKGRFIVNPAVHEKFERITESITSERSRRHAAITSLGINRKQESHINNEETGVSNE
jgi:Protein of unknown function (DUF3987)